MIIWLLTGLWILLGCAEAAHLITIMTNRNLQTYITLCSIFVLAGLFVYMGISFWYNRRKIAEEKPLKKSQISPYMICFIVISGMTLYHFVSGYIPDMNDAVYHIVIGNVHSGSLMTEHPFVGGQSAAAMPMRMQILGLSSLYSAVITESQQSQYMIMCRVVPLIVWTLAMLLYGAFAQKLFSDNVHKRWIFMSIAAFLVWATAGSEGALGYRMFYAGFSGETIRGALLMPYTIYVCWQKKWLLGLLAIAAEACLVWTTYGIGYCLLITSVMFVVHLLISRRKVHAA